MGKAESNSWRLSIANARDEIADLLDDNLSLETVIGEVTASAYRYARRKAAIETDLGEQAFPPQCPWSFAEAMDGGFWPEWGGVSPRSPSSISSVATWGIAR